MNWILGQNNPSNYFALTTETYLSHPDQEICLAFSSAESINAVISILQAMKKNIFEDETTREYAIQRNMELEGR